MMTCEIGDSANRFVTAGTLLSQSETTCQLKLADCSARLPALHETVTLRITRDTGETRLYTAVVGAIFGDILLLTQLHAPDAIQRRSDVKLRMTAQFMAHPVFREKKNGRDVYVCDVSRRINIVLSDISAGGMAFFSKQPLSADQLYLLVFPFTREAIELLFTIVRSEPWADGYFYSCRFAQTPIHTERLLRSFVYYHGLQEAKESTQ